MKQLMTMILVALMAVGVQAQGNRLLMEDFVIEPDSTIVMPLIFANIDSMRGIQFNISPPLGLSIDRIKASRNSKKLGMTVSSYEQNGISTVMVYQMGLGAFPPDSIPVANVVFVADSGFRGGEIEIWKSLGATLSHASIAIDGDTVIVTVPQAKLIGNPIDQQQGKDHYFNLEEPTVLPSEPKP
ncbi:MAG: hypothetical protein IKX18_00580 [Muribaculaceae bacterium]|nr:hypothetical protein [Muribaculaceae bacterium]